MHNIVNFTKLFIKTCQFIYISSLSHAWVRFIIKLITKHVMEISIDDSDKHAVLLAGPIDRGNLT